MFMPSEKRILLSIQCAINTAISKPFACSFLNKLAIQIEKYEINENNITLFYSYAIEHLEGTNKTFYINEAASKLTIDLLKSKISKDYFNRTCINYNGIEIVL